jgi:hypothetical protein
MAMAGLVLGIVAIVLSFIPCIGFFAITPAILGIIFSIIGLSQAKKTGQGKGMAIAGLVLSILAIVWIPIFILLIVGGAAAGAAAGGPF